MMVLDTTTSKLRLVTSAAGAIHSHVSYVEREMSTKIDTPKTQNTASITTATTTDVLGVPASDFRRNATLWFVKNAHATVTNIVKGLHTDGTTELENFQCTLLPGEWCEINDAGTFFHFDANGVLYAGTGPGRLIKSTFLTAGTSFTTQPGVTKIKIEVQGGGAGGGGCTSVAAAAAAAGGGGAGAYAQKEFVVTPNTAYAYTIGAAGNGASGAAGGNGGSSTFVVSGTTVTAPGGTGGPQAVAATTLTARAGGAGGTVATNGDINSGGEPGRPGVVLIVAGPIGASGPGGPSVFGGGGLGIVAVGNGNAATGFGAGGGGALTGASAVRTGGNGTGGCIVVDEYSG